MSDRNLVALAIYFPNGSMGFCLLRPFNSIRPSIIVHQERLIEFRLVESASYGRLTVLGSSKIIERHRKRIDVVLVSGAAPNIMYRHKTFSALRCLCLRC